MTKNTEVARAVDTLPGLLPDAEAEAVLASFHLSELDGQRVIDRLPTPQERSVLQRRVVAINKTLRPTTYTMTDQDAVVRALSTMFMGFPSTKNSNARDLVAAYLVHLQELPRFAIERACSDIGKRVIKDLDPDFAPTSPRVYEIAERHAAKLYGEKLRFDHVLETKVLPPAPVSPEHAEKMRGLMHGLAEELREKNERLESEEIEQRARERIEANNRRIERGYAESGKVPVVTGGVLISPELQELVRQQLRPDEG